MAICNKYTETIFTYRMKSVFIESYIYAFAWIDIGQLATEINYWVE